jgi:hypothetical protein
MCKANTQAPPPGVTAIDLIIPPTSGVQGLPPTSAVQGFPTVRGVNLNVVGWLNDTTTNFACRIVFQVQFTVAGLSTSKLDLLRSMDRVASAVSGPDGSRHQDATGGFVSDRPSNPTVLRPSESLIVVSDCPGLGSVQKKSFPATYHATFRLSLVDLALNKPYAQISYVIDIQKQTFDDASPTQSFGSVVKRFF